MSEAPSPADPAALLSEVTTDQLEELFARDPADLTREDVATIVRGLRQRRASWAQEEQSAQSAGRRARPKAAKVPLTLAEIGDIEL